MSSNKRKANAKRGRNRARKPLGGGLVAQARQSANSEIVPRKTFAKHRPASPAVSDTEHPSLDFGLLGVFDSLGLDRDVVRQEPRDEPDDSPSQLTGSSGHPAVSLPTDGSASAT